jgi:hypothetical protein
MARVNRYAAMAAATPSNEIKRTKWALNSETPDLGGLDFQAFLE